MADNFTLADCLVPYEWKREQDTYEQEHGKEKEGATTHIATVEYPRLGLSEAARLAREAGMNYGEYMAKRGIFPPLPRRRKQTMVELYAQGFVRYCAMCGKPVPKGQRKYCLECREVAYWSRMVGRDAGKVGD